jgi:NAD(P)H dehydrogenase (quinone)
MIVITGATGQLGRAIVKAVVNHVPVNEVGVSVRDLVKAADLKTLGVRVRQGNFDDPDSLQHAFEGASQVLIVSSNARACGGDPLAQHRSAINAARAVGAGRIVYTSHMGASVASAFPPMRDHATNEDMLRQSGLAWTALRNGFYGASGVAMMGDSLETGLLEAPADGKVSWTAHADLAEAAAIILNNEGRYEGPTTPFTGSESLDFSDLAAVASGVLNRPVRRHVLKDEDLRSKLTARGAPDRAADTVLGFYIASRNGEFAAVNPALEQLLGRRPTKMRDLIARKVFS